jgi:hypothetical protein
MADWLRGQEEIGHAELAFAVARVLGWSNAAEPVYTPHGVTVSGDMDALLRDTLEEGCLMETVGALDAARRFEAEGISHNPRLRVTFTC